MIRCPSCHGKGTVGSATEALRRLVGNLRAGDFANPKDMERAMALYQSLSMRSVPAVSSPAGPMIAGASARHAAAPTEHIGARKWRASCACGATSEIRGTETAASKEIGRHIAREGAE